MDIDKADFKTGTAEITILKEFPDVFYGWPDISIPTTVTETNCQTF